MAPIITQASFTAPVAASSSNNGGGSPSSSAPAAPSGSSAGGSGIGNVYKFYTGSGSTSAGWPSIDSWASFDDLWSSNQATIHTSCAQFGESNNSPAETQDIHDAILSVASASGVDERFILAIMMQESKGCVRVPTTNYGVDNPGLLQSHDGTGSCNNGAVQDPCPANTITQMIKDGVEGTSAGPGLKGAMDQCQAQGAQQYYEAARVYNSGSIAAGGNLGAGIATHCYASDVANRLTGWTTSSSLCTLD